MNTVETELGIKQSKLTAENVGKNPGVDSQVLLSPEREQKLDLLLHLISNLSESLVVCGPDGIGKSTVLRLVSERKFATWSVCLIVATAGLTFQRIQDRLLQGICEDEVHASMEEVDIQLKKKLAQFALNNQYIILLLDDAGALMPGVLTKICTFAESFSPLRPVFSMTADHLQLMSASDPVVDNCQVIEIPPLTEQQCEEFLKNLSGKPDSAIPYQAISAKLVEKVYRESHGVPGEILSLLPEISKDGDFRPATGSFPLASAFALAAAFTIGFLLWNGSKEIGDDSISGPIVSRNKNSNSRNIDVPKLSASKEKLEDMVPGNSSKKPDNSLADWGQVPTLQLPTRPDLPETSSAIIAANSKGADNSEKLDQSEQSAVEYLSLDTSTEAADENGITAVVDFEKHVQTKSPAALSTENFGSKDTAADTEPGKIVIPADGPLPDTQKASVNDPAKLDKPGVKKTDTDTVSQAIPGVKDVNWILSQNADQFTLQLVAVQKFEDMINFIEKYSTLDGLALFKTRKNDQDWYALLYGTYPSLAGAKREADKLPRALQKSWPRKMKSVHRSINKFNAQHQ